MKKETNNVLRNTHLYMILGLLCMHIVNGDVFFTTNGDSYFNKSFTLRFIFSTTFTTSATISQDGVLQSSCIPTVCGPNALNGVTFDPSVTEIRVVFNPVSSSQKGDWKCILANGDNVTYTFNPTSVPSSNQCAGTRKFKVTISSCHGGSLAIVIVVLILLYCCCDYTFHSHQMVKIRVTAENPQQLVIANQKINGGNQQQITIIQQKTCSIDVSGEDRHEFQFGTARGVVKLNFMIKDDLLHVVSGQTITLPTVLQLNLMFSTLTWYHNRNVFLYGGLQFITTVTRTTYGVYDIKLTFEQLGLTIWIDNMRVQGTYWIIMGISVGFNIVCAVISVVITVVCRSTDEFCVEVYVNILIQLGILCVVILLVVVLVNFLFKKRTGNEKSKGNLKEMDSNDSPLVEDKGPIGQISGGNNF